jgi:hypothetical protein
MGLTIFLCINHGINVRDVLRGGIYRTLRESGHRIVIVTPAYAQPEFVEEFAANNVVIEPLGRHRPGGLERAMDTWRLTFFPEMSDSVRMLTAPRGRRSVFKRVARTGVRVVKAAMGVPRFTRCLLALMNLLFPDRHHRELFARYRPDVVVVTEVFSLAPDSWVLKRAQRLGVPIVWLVRSWDNLTSKGALPVVDRMVVWSEDMKRDAVALHHYPPEHVYVAGTPQFDHLVDEQVIPSRTEFCRRIGADPNKALILYAMAPLTRADAEFEVEVVERLWQLARDDALGVPCQILARAYPLRGFQVHERLARLSGLLIDVPGRESPAFTDRDIGVDDMRHLAATLRYSSVVVNVASTIVLEAAVVGTPAVCIAFDFDDERARDYYASHVRYFDHDHYQKLRATGGVRLARSMDDLRRIVRMYLEDRTVDAEGRRRILEVLSARVDGHAGERVGKFILQHAADVAAVRARSAKETVPA